MMVTFLYILINITHPELKGEAIACSMGLFIFYTWRRILLILITAAIAFALVSFFPFLAPVAFILMVIIFIARLSYILKNWRAVLAGFYMYALAFGFAFYGSVFGELIWGISFYHYRLNGINPLWGYQGLEYTLAAVAALFFTVIFHFIMRWLYRHHYTLQQALPIMGVAPLLIILLLMPFVKALDGFDSMDTVDSTDTSMDTADTFDTADGPTDAYDLAHHGTPDTPGHDVSDAPGVHHTQDYFRTGPDGSPQHVSGYDATNPDGIVENNFSYHGAASHDGTADVPADAAPADSISAETVDHAMDSLDAAADSRPAFLQAKEENKRKQPPTGKEIIS